MSVILIDVFILYLVVNQKNIRQMMIIKIINNQLINLHSRYV